MESSSCGGMLYYVGSCIMSVPLAHSLTCTAPHVSPHISPHVNETFLSIMGGHLENGLPLIKGNLRRLSALLLHAHPFGGIISQQFVHKRSPVLSCIMRLEWVDVFKLLMQSPESMFLRVYIEKFVCCTKCSAFPHHYSPHSPTTEAQGGSPQPS